MDAKTCLKKLEYVGVLSFATVNGHGEPRIRNISAIHYEPEKMVFFTARGKDFAQELLEHPAVAVLGYTKYKEMIRLFGQAVPVPEEEREHWIDVIFAEQPYLYNVYPNDTGKLAGMVFEISKGEIEYFNLGVRPIFRESYGFGPGKISQRGFIITDRCIGCGKCVKNCPQKAITPGSPAEIQQNHCLHCGNCFSVCPVQAVEKRMVQGRSNE